MSNSSRIAVSFAPAYFHHWFSKARIAASRSLRSFSVVWTSTRSAADINPPEPWDYCTQGVTWIYWVSLLHLRGKEHVCRSFTERVDAADGEPAVLRDGGYACSAPKFGATTRTTPCAHRFCQASSRERRHPFGTDHCPELGTRTGTGGTADPCDG